MTGFVVDASVAFKWLVDEELTDAAARLLTLDQPLVAPPLLYAEVANALWTTARRGDITEDDMREALHLLVDAPISTPATMLNLMPIAAQLAADLDHPVYDCFYLALALREQRPVITADRRFHDIVKGHAYLSANIEFLGTLH